MNPRLASRGGFGSFAFLKVGMLALTLCVCGGQIGCGGGSSSSKGSAPSGLSYPQSSIVATVGTAITTDTPTVTGTVTSYAVSPALPAGLSLSTSTGAISGTPTTPSAQASYTVTASNANGSTTASVAITVNAALSAPSGLSYPQTSIVATVGTAITTDTPTVTGTVTSYAISPALPGGLTLSTTTGAISGTPTAASAQASYTVTASNASGSTTASVQITVNAALSAPSGLSYPQTSIVATVGTAITTDTPTVTGTVTSYAVSPALPAGLTLSTTTGAISGTPTTAASQASFTITASNASGSTTATVQITVNATASAPANLSYATATIAAIDGEAITTDTPTVTGTVTSWSVTPQLPTGLSLNATTGAIGGTPSTVVSSSNYTVKAANAAGSTTTVVQIGVVTASVNQAVHATFVSGHQSFHAALNYTYTPLNFALPTTSPIKESLTRSLKSHLHAVRPDGAPGGTTISYNDDLGLYQSDIIQNGTTAAINYYLDAAATIPAGATTMTFPAGITAGNYLAANYPINIQITQNVNAGSIPCTGGGTIVILDSTGKNTIQGSLTLTKIGLTVTADISLTDGMNVIGSGTINENGETITVTGMKGPFTGNIAGAAVLTPQNYSGSANISITTGTFSAVFNTPNGMATCNSANGLLSIQYPDGTTETLTNPNSTQPNAPPVPTTGGPSKLSYALATISATQGEVITNDSPTVTGTVTAWSITPTLPAGLAISATSGIISGTPTVVSGATDYVITAANASGFTQGSVEISVAAEPAPSGLSYAQATIAATVGTAIASDTPTVTGIVTTWSISPALPGGLTLDASSGILSGTPTATSAQTTYTITAANASGSTTATVQITVAAASTGPASVKYPVTTIVVNEDAAITPDVPTITGTVSGFIIAPQLPYGMSIDPKNGTISGAPSTQLASTTFSIFVPQITGAAATIQLTVNEAPIQGIAAQDAVFTGSTQNLASFASTTAQSYEWSLVDQTSGGTITSGSASDLIRYTAGATTGTYQLNVETKAASGNTTTASRTLHVVNQQFLKDPTSSWDRGTPSYSVLANGSILFVGGIAQSTSALTSSEVFDPVSQTFSETAQPNIARGVAQAQVTLANGKVLVCGGVNTVYGSGYQTMASAEIYDPSADSWTTVASMNSTRGWHTATLLQSGKVLVSGGQDINGNVLASSEIYDPVANTWTAVASLNSARNQHAAFLLSDGTVMVVGGSGLPYGASGQIDGVAAVEVYDPVANTWTAGGNLNTPRVGNTATLMTNGQVLVSGGIDDNFNYLNSAEVYNTATKTWSYTSGTLVTSSTGATATSLSNGQVLVAGGELLGDFTTPTASAEIYDPSAQTWTAIASMNTPRFNHIATALPNGNVLVAYGPCLDLDVFSCNVPDTQGAPDSLGAAETYNLAANTWTPVGMVAQLPGYNNGQYATGFTATLLASGQVLLAGGGASNGIGAANTAQLFNPSTNAWTLAAAMNTARSNHTATLLADGKVLVAGGDMEPVYAGQQFAAVLNSAEIYDPAANTWTAVASLITGRTQHTATLLANGKVLVAGGLDSNGNLVAAAEVYDPTANTWTAAGSLITPRYLHTATLLNTGKVLVAGGDSSTAQVGSYLPITAAELYDPSTNTWTAAASLPSAVLGQTATLLSNGTVLLAGGNANSGGANGGGPALLYTPTSNSWSTLASLNYYRNMHTATLLSNGQILVTGGTDGPGYAVSPSELYTPSTNTWTQAAPLNIPRWSHSAVLLSDGRVMIVGGAPGYIPEYWKP